MANEIPVISPDMRKVYLRLKRWRSSHARRVPIPDSLWRRRENWPARMGLIPPRKLCTWSMASSSSGRKVRHRR